MRYRVLVTAVVLLGSLLAAVPVGLPLRDEPSEAGAQTKPTVTVASATSRVTEGTSITFTIKAEPAPPADLQVKLLVSDGSLPGTSRPSVIIKANTTSVTHTVKTGDMIDEPDTKMTAGIERDDSNYSLGFPSAAEVEVIDDDPTKVSVKGGGGSVAEGAFLDYTVDPGRYLAKSESVTVNFAPAGTATQGSDYAITCDGKGVSCTGLGGAAPALKITGGSGVRNATIRVSASSDSAHPETAETAGISLRSGHTNTGSGGGISVTGSPSTFTIVSPAPPAITASFGAATHSAGEAAGSRTVTVPVSLSAAAPAGGLSVSYTVGGTAVAADRGALSGTVAIAQGATSANITVTVTDDNLAEASETIVLTLTDGTDYDLGTTATTTVTIDDNDTAPTAVALSVDIDSVDEGDAATTITVTATVQGATRFAEAKTVTVTVTGSGGAGVVGFTAAPASFNISVAAGAQTGTNTFVLTPSDDSADESDETVTVASTLSGVTFTDATITVVDDDVPQASFASGTASVAEDGGTSNVTVNLSPVPHQNLTVTYTLSGSAGRSSDYTISGVTSSTGTVVVGTTGSAVIPVAVIDDSAVESAETVILTLTAGAGYDVGSPSAHTLTITDNDSAATPVVSVTAGAAVVEGTAASFTVSANPSVTGTVALDYTVSQTGVFVSHTNRGSQQVSLSGGTATITVPTVNDQRDEADGSVTVTLNNGTGYTVGTPSAATVTVTDNDVPQAGFASSASSAAENAGTRNVRLNLSPVPYRNTTVRYSLSGNATRNSDYRAAGTVSVSAGSPFVNIPVAIIDDSTRESSETVVLTLTNGTGYALGATRTHTLTITDNDNRGTVTPPRPAPRPAPQPAPQPGPPPSSPQLPQLSVFGTTAVAEGDAATFTVFASVSAAGVSVRYVVTQHGEFVASGELGYKSVRLSGSSTKITVPGVDDNVDEPDGSVTVTLTSGSDYRIGAAVSASVTITDNDGDDNGDDGEGVDPVLSVSGGDSVVEGGAAVFTVSASEALSVPVEFTYTVTQNGNYVRADQWGPGRMRRISGESVTFRVSTVDDRIDETDGAIVVTLNTGDGYRVADDPRASVTVRDNDTVGSPGTTKPRYYQDALDWAQTNNIVGCVPLGSAVTRRQVVVALHKAAGSPEPARPHGFIDVPADIAAAVGWAVENAITTGTTPTTFSPDSLTTRAQVAAFLWRAADSPAADPGPFTDLTRDWQIAPVGWLADQNITTGRTPTIFNPNAPVIWAELITFIWRRQGSPPPPTPNPTDCPTTEPVPYGPAPQPVA